jgi:hypothetical protein
MPFLTTYIILSLLDNAKLIHIVIYALQINCDYIFMSLQLISSMLVCVLQVWLFQDLNFVHGPVSTNINGFS